MSNSEEVNEIIESHKGELERYKNAPSLIHMRPEQYPRAIDELVNKTIEQNPERYSEAQREMLRFIEFYTLVSHGMGQRKTGGYTHRHPFNVAQDVFKSGEQLFKQGEPWYVTAAAKAHDVVEDAVHAKMKSVRRRDNNADQEWRELPQNIRQKYKGKSRSSRTSHLYSLWWSTNEFVKKHLGNNSKLRRETSNFATILEVLSKKEYKDYFDYFNRLLSVPREKNQTEFYKEIGFRYRLNRGKRYDGVLGEISQAWAEGNKKGARGIFKRQAGEIQSENLNRNINHFKTNVTYPALRIKLKDRKDNTSTVYATEEGFESFPLHKQNYNIFKNLLVLSTTKANLKARSRFFGMEYEDLPEYQYNQDLLDTTIHQLERMKSSMLSRHPLLLGVKTPHYQAVLRVYDEFHGFEGKTQKGETKIPWWFSPFMRVPAKSFDGMMARYAGMIHRLLPEPEKEETPVKRLYKDVLAFLYVAKKLKHRRAYSPYFGFKKEEASDYLQKEKEVEEKESVLSKRLTDIVS